VEQASRLIPSERTATSNTWKKPDATFLSLFQKNLPALRIDAGRVDQQAGRLFHLSNLRGTDYFRFGDLRTAFFFRAFFSGTDAARRYSPLRCAGEFPGARLCESQRVARVKARGMD
jgi:hypothetical protein